MILDILLIDVIVCFIVDISGFVDTIKRTIWKWLRKDKPYQEYRLKPFDCSLCLCFWSGLIWLLIQGNISIGSVALVCMFSLIAEQISNILKLIKHSLQLLLDKIITKI